MKKTESAAQTIRELNPDVHVVAHEEMLDRDNVERLIAGYDVILDGTDTFETRYTLNDAAVRAGIPVVHASVFRFEGQLTVFTPLRGALLPLPVPHAATAGAGPGLLRRRRARRRARASWACCRPPRRSRCCSASATRWPAACSSTTPSTAPSASCSCGATRTARPAATARCRPARAARPRSTPAMASSPSHVAHEHPGGARMTAVRIPPVLRAQAGNQKRVEVSGATVGEALDALLAQHPGLREQLFTRRRQPQPLRQRLRQRPGRALRAGLETPVAEADKVILLPAMAGGRLGVAP